MGYSSSNKSSIAHKSTGHSDNWQDAILIILALHFVISRQFKTQCFDKSEWEEIYRTLQTNKDEITEQ